MEIEWYAPPAPARLTRQVYRLSKKLLSVWLEGLGFKPTIYGKQVQSRRLTISCFLAQDRVAEFAKMSPPLTLKETMRAAGDPRLTEWHQKLVTKGIEKKALDEKLNTDVARRDQVKTQMDKIQPDIEQFETRQEKEKEVSLRTKCSVKPDEVERDSGSDGSRCKDFSGQAKSSCYPDGAE